MLKIINFGVWGVGGKITSLHAAFTRWSNGFWGLLCFKNKANALPCNLLSCLCTSGHWAGTAPCILGGNDMAGAGSQGQTGRILPFPFSLRTIFSPSPTFCRASP